MNGYRKENVDSMITQKTSLLLCIPAMLNSVRVFGLELSFPCAFLAQPSMSILRYRFFKDHTAYIVVPKCSLTALPRPRLGTGNACRGKQRQSGRDYQNHLSRSRSIGSLD